MTETGKGIVLPGLATTEGGAGFNVERSEGKFVARVVTPSGDRLMSIDTTRGAAVEGVVRQLRGIASNAQRRAAAATATAAAVLSAEEVD